MWQPVEVRRDLDGLPWYKVVHTVTGAVAREPGPWGELAEAEHGEVLAEYLADHLNRFDARVGYASNGWYGPYPSPPRVRAVGADFV